MIFLNMYVDNVETDFKNVLEVLTRANFTIYQIHELLQTCTGDAFALVIPCCTEKDAPFLLLKRIDFRAKTPNS